MTTRYALHFRFVPASDAVEQEEYAMWRDAGRWEEYQALIAVFNLIKNEQGMVEYQWQRLQASLPLAAYSLQAT